MSGLVNREVVRSDGREKCPLLSLGMVKSDFIISSNIWKQTSVNDIISTYSSGYSIIHYMMYGIIHTQLVLQSSSSTLSMVLTVHNALNESLPPNPLLSVSFDSCHS